jgi:hypothetical protein
METQMCSRVGLALTYDSCNGVALTQHAYGLQLKCDTLVPQEYELGYTEVDTYGHEEDSSFGFIGTKRV